jgi:NAD-dependent deacetylase
MIYDIGNRPIHLGDQCPNGSQLRPHIVWFGEEVIRLEEARQHFLDAAKVLIVGTSLSVFPAAGLVKHARFAAEKVLIDLEIAKRPFGFQVIQGSADEVLPALVCDWCAA